MRIFAVLVMAMLSPALHAADISLPFATQSVDQIAARQTAMRHWKISLAPLIASQVLDVTSSWGMRELNPLLAQPDGGFGAKSAVLKFGVVGALVGVEYLFAKRSTRAARLFEKLNWTGAAVTSGLAIHNYAIR
jgi:hypothetical protein